MILLKVIIGVIGVVLFTVLVAYLYDVWSDVGNYDDWTHIDAYDEVLTQVDEVAVQIQDYVIYFYSDECVKCGEIQRDALRLVARINKNDTVVYFVNTAEIKEDTDGDQDLFLGEVNLSSIRTPMLVVVDEGEFRETAVGTAAVLDLLRDVKSGDYAPFQD
jgi:hypothetical protein